MTMPETLLILDDQPEVTELLARTLASPGRTIITANDCEAASLILERVPVALLISDVHFSSRFAFEGLSLIDEVRRASPRTRVLMISADNSEGLSKEAERRGAVGLMEKPFNVPLLKQAVASLVEGCERNGVTQSTIRVPLLERLIVERRIVPHFQPIVELSTPDGRAYGFESLARPQVEGVPFFDCNFLFKYAERKQMTVALDLLCLQQALWWGAPLARVGKLFINIHPQLLSGCSELASVVLSSARESSIPLNNIVLEITEQGRLAETPGASSCMESLRGHGVQFALDDVGMSYSHLDLMDWIKPSYLKISQHFGTRFELDSSKAKIVRNIVSLATAFDCEVILEGIEELTTSGAATRAGARFGQGFYYAKPQTVATFQ